MKHQEPEPEWVTIGAVADQLSADFAKETLDTYDIPVVVISKSGFFGTAGLVLTEFYSGSQGLFEISVPEDEADDAREILTATLGEKWMNRKD